MNRNPILLGVAAALGVVLLAVLVVIPKGREVSEIRSQIEAGEQELASLQAELAELRAAEQSGQTALQLSALREALPPTPDLASLLADLEQAATRSGVRLGSVSPGTPSSATTGSASSIALSVSVSGDYFSLARFLYELETQPRLIKVLAVSLAGGTGEGTLGMQVTAEAYTTDLNAGPGSDPAPGAEVGA